MGKRCQVTRHFTSRGLGGHFGDYLSYRWVAQRCSIGKLEGWNQLVAAVDRGDESGRVRIGLNVHFGVFDPGPHHLGLEALAIATPHRAVHNH